MNKVLIMLSTYNGEKYLREQLDSLYNQKGVDLYLLVRDDGSMDDTIEILENYKRTFGKMQVLKESNVGAAKSFYRLIEKATTDYRDFDYYAFSDQDDVWFDDKVLTGVGSLNVSSKIYKLFTSGAQTTDCHLNPITSKSKIKSDNTFFAKFVSNHTLGCTMIFNLALLDKLKLGVSLANNCHSKVLPLHDAWTSIVAYSLNADVIQLDKPLMYYRQHGDNVVGGQVGFFNMQWKRIKRYILDTPNVKSLRCKWVLDAVGDELPEQNKQMLILGATYSTHLMAKLELLFEPKIYCNGIVENIGLFFMILFNKF